MKFVYKIKNYLFYPVLRQWIIEKNEFHRRTTASSKKRKLARSELAEKGIFDEKEVSRWGDYLLWQSLFFAPIARMASAFLLYVYPANVTSHRCVLDIQMRVVVKVERITSSLVLCCQSWSPWVALYLVYR